MISRFKVFGVFLALVFSFGFVNYANATIWTTVGTAGFSVSNAYEPSFAISSTNVPYVGYQDASVGYGATVMKYNGSSWENVGTAGFSAGVVQNVSIAFAPNGVLYAGYQDVANGSKATVMKYNGSSWENVGTAGFSAGAVTYGFGSFSLDISSTNLPYVTYIDAANSNKATVMKYNGSSWQTVGTAGFSAGAVTGPTIALSSTDIPYVVYRDGGNSNKATVMKYNGSSWENVGTAGFSSGIIDYPYIVLSSTNVPYVVYQDANNGNKATVMKYNGSSWENVGTAGFSAGITVFSTIALSSSDVPYVVYKDGNNNSKATVMKYNGSSWENVGTAGFSAGGIDFSSILLDTNNNVYVGYRDSPAGDKSTVMMYDIVPPTITSITSDKTNGSYKDGEVVDIDVVFSKAVTSTGSVTITLETGDIDRTCSFTVSNGTTGTCDYTVQTGDTSLDLTVLSVSGIINDASENIMTDFVPTTNLAANKALVIDTTTPTITSVSSSNIANTTATISWNTNELSSSIVEYSIDTNYGSSTTEIDTGTGVTLHTVYLTGLTPCRNYNYRVKSNDPSLNLATSSNNVFTTTGCGAIPAYVLQAISDAARAKENQNNTPTNNNQNNNNINNGSKFIFSKNLKYKDNNTDVKELQKFLNSKGFIISKTGSGSLNNETTYFGLATRSALIKYQIANNIKPAVGYLGPATRAILNQ